MTISQEKIKFDLLLTEKNKLENDLKNILDRRNSQTYIKSSNSENDLKSTKKEKIILESLAIRINDLEVLYFNFIYSFNSGRKIIIIRKD